MHSGHQTLYMYIYKGHDRASVLVNDVDGNNDINDIENYRKARWVGLRFYGEYMGFI